MDRVGWQILGEELQSDRRVLEDAVVKARARLAHSVPGHLEACGFELHRLYNVLEKTFERICTGFENHFERRGDFHERLIERMTLALAGVRPAYLPAVERDGVRELKGFRHLFRHAYDLKLRGDRLAELVGIAERVVAAFPEWNRVFLEAVAAEQGWAGRAA